MNPDVIEFTQVMVVIMGSIATFAVVVLGSRVLWRWGSRVKPAQTLDAREHDDRLHHLETAVDSIAIEVERISEAQRFMVGLLGESIQARRSDAALPARSPGRVNTPH